MKGNPLLADGADVSLKRTGSFACFRLQQTIGRPAERSSKMPSQQMGECTLRMKGDGMTTLFSRTRLPCRTVGRYFFKHWSRLILSLWLTRSRLYKYQNKNTTSSLRPTWYHEPKDLLARWFYFLFILTVFHLDFLLADAGQNCSKSEAAIHQWCCRRLRH